MHLSFNHCKTQTAGLLRPCDDVTATTLKQANLARLPLLARMASSLDTFARMRMATISYVMSVRPRGTTWLPLDEFSWNLISADYWKICRENSSFIKISGVPRGGVWGVQTPPPEIPKISAESLIAWARRAGVSIFFCSSLCSHTVVIY